MRRALPSAEAVIAAVRARGSDATDLRDAAHEAAHAFDGGAKRWDRDSIHAALLRLPHPRADMFRSEVLARTVEQIVCADLGVDCGTVEKWAGVAVREAAHYGIAFSDYDTFLRLVRQYMDGREARKVADRVIDLGRRRV